MVTSRVVPAQVYERFRDASHRFANWPNEKLYFDSLVTCAREMINYSDGFEIMGTYLSPEVQTRVYAQL
jgi:hypothetical protein